MIRSLPESIINTRPLVFLCGPYYDEQDTRDRRRILRLTLGDKKTNYGETIVIPFALIIDNLISTVRTGENSIPGYIKLSLLEEIIASCAYKNYVFVDTMSTALELGLFSNSLSQNSTTAFLPSDYGLFKPSIGGFFRDTIDKSSNITECIYVGKRINKYTKNPDGKTIKVHENLIGFRGKTLPKAIKKQIAQDFISDNDKFLVRIDFSDVLTENSKILFHITSDILLFVVPPAILLYLVNRYKKIETIQEVLFTYFIRHYSNKSTDYKRFIINQRRGLLKIQIETPFKENAEIVIKHILYLIERIANIETRTRYKNLEYKAFNFSFYRNDISFFDLVGFTVNEIDEINDFGNRMGRATRKKHITINGKSRKITMYAGNNEGFQLRQMNTKIKNELESLVEIHPRAFAYRKNHSTMQCIRQHINSFYFLKIDIHDFFGSVSKRIMKQLLKMHLSNDKNKCFEEWKNNRRTMNPGKTKSIRYLRKNSLVDNWEGLTAILSLCFVNGHLPLGLTSSPWLSNVYMYFFDEWITTRFPNLIYTRYSDDMLISSEEPFDTIKVYEAVRGELQMLNLEINEKKIQNLHLAQDGDHVKFLGLNIIRKESQNFISVGKKYIRETCLLISQDMQKNSNNCSPQTVGRVKYIKYISENDYKYLKEFFEYKNHSNSDIIDRFFD